MKLAVIGASGRTGRLVVERALSRGDEVTAFVRNPARFVLEGESLRVVVGDVLYPKRVEEAVAGQDAVLSVIGHVKGSPPDVQTRGTQNIIAAMKKHGVDRLVSLTGAGVSDPGDRPEFADRAIVFLLKALQGKVLRDAVQHARVIESSGLEWVIVRGPRLTDGPFTGRYHVGYVGGGSGTKVSRADVADFMLRQASEGQYLGTKPMISDPKVQKEGDG